MVFIMRLMNRLMVQGEAFSLGWSMGVSITMRSFSKNHIDVEVTEDVDSEKWRMIGF